MEKQNKVLHATVQYNTVRKVLCGSNPRFTELVDIAEYKIYLARIKDVEIPLCEKCNEKILGAYP